MVEAVSTSSSRGGQVPPPRGNFDVRVDALAPGVLYLASGADQDGVVSSAFLHVRDKHLSYDLPALKGAQAPSNPDTWRELCKSSIFWLQSDALQLDDEAHVDASWAAESIEVARELRALAGAEVPGGNPADCDAARVNGPYPPSANFRVLDLAAGVGGNLVYFGLDSYLAVGVELNPARVAICRNNVAAYGLSNTHVVEGDLFEFAEQFAEDPSAKVAELGLQSHFPDPPMFDCVHISPPWGGKLYSGASDDGLFMLQRTFDVGRAMLSMAKIAHMVSLYLPRSQSVHEIVSLAALGGFPLVLIAAYHTTKKVRCIHAHFVRRVECFAHLQLHNMEVCHNSVLFVLLLAAFRPLQAQAPRPQPARPVHLVHAAHGGTPVGPPHGLRASRRHAAAGREVARRRSQAPPPAAAPPAPRRRRPRQPGPGDPARRRGALSAPAGQQASVYAQKQQAEPHQRVHARPHAVRARAGQHAPLPRAGRRRGALRLARVLPREDQQLRRRRHAVVRLGADDRGEERALQKRHRVLRPDVDALRRRPRRRDAEDRVEVARVGDVRRVAPALVHELPPVHQRVLDLLPRLAARLPRQQRRELAVLQPEAVVHAAAVRLEAAQLPVEVHRLQVAAEVEGVMHEARVRHPAAARDVVPQRLREVVLQVHAQVHGGQRARQRLQRAEEPRQLLRLDRLVAVRGLPEVGSRPGVRRPGSAGAVQVGHLHDGVADPPRVNHRVEQLRLAAAQLQPHVEGDGLRGGQVARGNVLQRHRQRRLRAEERRVVEARDEAQVRLGQVQGASQHDLPAQRALELVLHLALQPQLREHERLLQVGLGAQHDAGRAPDVGLGRVAALPHAAVVQVRLALQVRPSEERHRVLAQRPHELGGEPPVAPRLPVAEPERRVARDAHVQHVAALEAELVLRLVVVHQRLGQVLDHAEQVAHHGAAAALREPVGDGNQTLATRRATTVNRLASARPFAGTTRRLPPLGVRIALQTRHHTLQLASVQLVVLGQRREELVPRCPLLAQLERRRADVEGLEHRVRVAVAQLQREARREAREAAHLRVVQLRQLLGQGAHAVEALHDDGVDEVLQAVGLHVQAKVEVDGSLRQHRVGAFAAEREVARLRVRALHKQGGGARQLLHAQRLNVEHGARVVVRERAQRLRQAELEAMLVLQQVVAQIVRQRHLFNVVGVTHEILRAGQHLSRDVAVLAADLLEGGLVAGALLVPAVQALLGGVAERRRAARDPTLQRLLELVKLRQRLLVGRHRLRVRRGVPIQRIAQRLHHAVPLGHDALQQTHHFLQDGIKRAQPPQLVVGGVDNEHQHLAQRIAKRRQEHSVVVGEVVIQCRHRCPGVTEIPVAVRVSAGDGNVCFIRATLHQELRRAQLPQDDHSRVCGTGRFHAQRLPRSQCLSIFVKPTFVKGTRQPDVLQFWTCSAAALRPRAFHASVASVDQRSVLFERAFASKAA
ncbi:trimethylguanosine synthase [Babesia caballi]|uniref:Trimethylguanosine synthase n=1 Tax=Babesia caballi TaxID=5871 RepID=A0AAV4LT89_BABCB|nr:trimethylguanosine synthase [Babesia caballi]